MPKASRVTMSVLVLASAGALASQSPCRLVADINKNKSAHSSSPAGYVKHGSGFLFVATTRATGQELFRTDGTKAGTSLVKDIAPGTKTSKPFDMTAVNGRILFTADDGNKGRELWSSDGTTAGTVLLRDIRPGAVGSDPGNFAVVGNHLYFTADDGTSGRELWRTDGTSSGTKLVSDIRVGSSGSAPNSLAARTSTELLFTANDGKSGRQLWKTSGTPATTSIVKILVPGSSAYGFRNHNGTTLFISSSSSGCQLWKTDGTATGTTAVKMVAPANAKTAPFGQSAILGKYLYFFAGDKSLPLSSYGVWRTDATASGTTLFHPLTDPGMVLHANGSKIYCMTYTGSVAAVWASDSTAAGMTRVYYSGFGARTPGHFADFGTRVLFIPDFTMWVSDGTPSGTGKLQLQTKGMTAYWDYGADVGHLSPTDLLFTSFHRDTGTELHRLTATSTGATEVLVADIEPFVSTRGSQPQPQKNAFGRTLYFSADPGGVGSEPFVWTAAGGVSFLKDIKSGISSSNLRRFQDCLLGGRAVTVFEATGIGVFVTDGTAAGTVRLAGDSRRNPPRPVCCGGRLYFSHIDSTRGDEPWISDGTPAGTKLLKDIQPSSGSSGPQGFCCVGDKVFFTAMTFPAGRELWVTDGTTSGTKLVKDINPVWSSLPEALTAVRGKLVFSASTAAAGKELWISDGTASGTAMVADIETGSGSSWPWAIQTVPGGVVFTAHTASSGRELWFSDLTAKGTRLLKDIRPGSSASGVDDFRTLSGQRLVFTADDGSSGKELWTTDFTTAGTRMVKDIAASGGSTPSMLTSCHDRMFFLADDGVNGRELWVTDGTSSGTVLVKDTVAGSKDSTIREMVRAGRGVVFASDEGVFASDGTSAGTTRLCAKQASGLSICDGRLFFSSTDTVAGEELHVLPNPGATVVGLSANSRTGAPRLSASEPVLGTTVTIDATTGPARYGGFLVASAPMPPRPVPFGTGSASFIDLSLFAIVAVGSAPSFTTRVALPDAPNLRGVQASLQAWWVHGGASPMFETSNGLLMTLRR